MVVKKGGQRNKHHLSHAVRSKTRRLRAAAPARPSTNVPDGKPAAQGPKLDARNPRFAEELVADSAADQAARLPSVMLVITILAVLYLAFIAWQVAQMPAK